MRVSALRFDACHQLTHRGAGVVFGQSLAGCEVEPVRRRLAPIPERDRGEIAHTIARVSWRARMSLLPYRQLELRAPHVLEHTDTHDLVEREISGQSAIIAHVHRASVRDAVARNALAGERGLRFAQPGAAEAPGPSASFRAAPANRVLSKSLAPYA